MSENFGYRKILCIREGGITYLRRKLFVTEYQKKFRWGTLRCFRKFRVSQNFMHKKGISVSSVETFLSHSADKIRRRTLLRFERILVSKIFMYRRGGGASRFCRNFLSHWTEMKSFVKEPFCFPESFRYRKILYPRGEYHDFR